MKRANPKKSRWQDHYSRQAKKERFPARSVYKLKEIQKKYHLIKKGDHVLDLGCYPGSWLLYAADLTGNQGQVVGIDLEPVTLQLPPHVRVYTGDILTMEDTFFKSLGNHFNLVLSDMAPATTGNKHIDSARSYQLCQAALAIAHTVLIPGGSFVCKIFHGEDFTLFINSIKSSFTKHTIFKPKSSRKASKEIFIIGLGKK
ncbi:MAG: RlmE family RNA methyltransferase [Desulfobacterales bacterium]|nr:MAG: RlmE family RNA methyltransferase [Desulfobacterales bacterium]